MSAAGAVLGEMVLRIGVSTKQAVADLMNFKKMLQGMGDQMSSWGGDLLMAGSAINAAVVPGALKALSVFSDINQSLQESRSIAGATVEAWRPVTQMVEDLGIKTQFMQADIAKGVRLIAQAGYTASDVMDPLIKNASDAAAAWGDDLPHAIGLTISAMESFKGNMIGDKTSPDNIKRVVDSMTGALVASRLDPRDLNFFFRQMGGRMATEKEDPENVLALFGTLNQVMGNGARAATGLRQAWDFMIRAQGRNDVIKEIAPILKKVGLTMTDINPRAVGLVKAMQNIKKAGLDMHPKAALFFGVEGTNAIQVIGEGIDTYTEMRATIDTVADAATLAKNNLDTLHGSWMLFKSSVEAWLNRIGKGLSDAYANRWLKGLKDSLNSAFEAFKGKEGTLASWIVKMAGFGSSLMGVGIVFKGIGSALNTVGSLFSVQGLVLVTVLSMLYKWWRKSATGAKEFLSYIKDAIYFISIGEWDRAVEQWDIAWKKAPEGLVKALAIFKQLRELALAIGSELATGKELKTTNGKNPMIDGFIAARKHVDDFIERIYAVYGAISKGIKDMHKTAKDASADWDGTLGISIYISSLIEQFTAGMINAFFTILTSPKVHAALIGLAEVFVGAVWGAIKGIVTPQKNIPTQEEDNARREAAFKKAKGASAAQLLNPFGVGGAVAFNEVATVSNGIDRDIDAVIGWIADKVKGGKKEVVSAIDPRRAKTTPKTDEAQRIAEEAQKNTDAQMLYRRQIDPTTPEFAALTPHEKVFGPAGGRPNDVIIKGLVSLLNDSLEDQPKAVEKPEEPHSITEEGNVRTKYYRDRKVKEYIDKSQEKPTDITFQDAEIRIEGSQLLAILRATDGAAGWVRGVMAGAVAT